MRGIPFKETEVLELAVAVHVVYHIRYGHVTKRNGLLSSI